MANPMGAMPKPGAVTRHKPQFEWTLLPEGGNSNPAPDMPPGFQWSMKAQDLWSRLWHSPQSLMWNVDTMPLLERLIAIYDDLFTRGTIPASYHAIVDKIEDKLGLNPRALMQLRWRIVPDHLATVNKSESYLAVVTGISDKPKRRRDIDY